MDRASVCCLVLPVSEVLGGVLCHLQRLLVLELLRWGSRVTPRFWEEPGSWDAEDGGEGSEVWALDGWCAGHFLGLLGSQIVPGKEEQGSDTQDPWGKEEVVRSGALFSPRRQLKAGDVCRESCAPHICFSSNSARTAESLLKGNRWTTVWAPESSTKSSYHDHSLRPMVFH